MGAIVGAAQSNTSISRNNFFSAKSGFVLKGEQRRFYPENEREALGEPNQPLREQSLNGSPQQQGGSLIWQP